MQISVTSREQNFTGIYRIVTDEKGINHFVKNIMPALKNNVNEKCAIEMNIPVFRTVLNDTLSLAVKKSGYNQNWVLNNAAQHGGCFYDEKRYIWIFTGNDIHKVPEYISKRINAFKKNVRIETFIRNKVPEYCREFVAVISAIKKERPKFDSFMFKNGMKEILLEEAVLIRK